MEFKYNVYTTNGFRKGRYLGGANTVSDAKQFVQNYFKDFKIKPQFINAVQDIDGVRIEYGSNLTYILLEGMKYNEFRTDDTPVYQLVP